MTDLRAEEIIAAFLENPVLSTLQSLVAQSPRARIIRRCAVAREFDRAVYETVLAKGVDGAPPFEKLADWPEIIVRSREQQPAQAESSIARAKTYAVQNRAAELEEWRRELSPAGTDAELPPPIADVNRALAAYCESLGQTGEVDRLYHLLVFDHTTARAELIRLYAAADQRFDLAVCQELLSLAGERYKLLPPDLKALIDDRRTYLQARSLWMDEYYKSRLYFPRAEVHTVVGAAVEGFLDAFLTGPAWIADVSATGGMGKTAAIRWQIAHRCVPEPPRIPVARIDFDFHSPYSVMVDPVRLLALLARQLDAQMTGQPFSDILPELVSYGQGVAATGAVQVEDLDTKQIDRFARVLLSARGDKPVLVIFDTVEVAMFSTATFDALLTLLERLHDTAPALRVLFSGRYSLKEKIPLNQKVPPLARFGTQVVSLTIAPFTDAEAEAYLKDKRCIADDALVRSVIRKAGGLPFKLALYGDIIVTTPGLTSEDIERYADVDLIYLIERIVQRLENPRLRWLLRYGVVPRRLTLPFFRDVMADFLPPAMTGQSRDDRPALGLPAQSSGVFVQSDELRGAVDVDALWTELSSYASQHAWISADAETLTFHGEVLDPMRRLLRRNRVFRKLHREAIRYYDALANDSDDLAWTREAIYHRFQLGTRDAAGYWRAAVRSALQTSPSSALELAEELTATYFDGEAPVRDEKGKPVVNPALLGDAFLVHAQAKVRLARKNRDNDAWDVAGTPADMADRCYRLAGMEPPIDVAVIHASIALVKGNVTAAAKVLAGLRAANASERVALALLRAELALARGSVDEVVSELREANRLLRPALFSAGSRTRVLADREQRDVESFVAFTLAEYASRIGRYDEASSVLQKHRRRVREAEDVAAVDLAEARLLIRRSLGAEAARTLPRSNRQALPTAAARITLTMAETLRIRHQPLRALAMCEQVLRPASVDPEVRAEATQLHAGLLTDLLEHGAARVAFEDAIAAWDSVGNGERKAECFEAGARAELTHFGDIGIAEDLVSGLERSSVAVREQFRILLLRAEISAARGRKVRRELQGAAKQAQTPVDRVRLALAGLRRDDKRSQSGYVKILVEALAKVEPPAARLPLLAALRYCPPVRVERSLGNRFARLLPKPPFSGDRGVKHDEDRILLGIRLADALTAFQMPRAAADAVRWCASKDKRTMAPLLAHELNVVAGRAGIEPPFPRPWQQWKKALGSHDNLLAMVLVEEAEALHGRDPAAALALVETAGAQTMHEATQRMLQPRIETIRSRATQRKRPLRKRPKRHNRKINLSRMLSNVTARTMALSTLAEASPAFSTLWIQEENSTEELRGTPRSGLTVFARAKSYHLERSATPWNLGRPSSEVVSHAFAAQHYEHRQMTEKNLVRFLFNGLPAHVLEQTGDVALAFKSSYWHSFPWEIALRATSLYGPAKSRFIYRTRGRSIQMPPRNPVVNHRRVLVVRSTEESQRSSHRGAYLYGQPADEYYRESGLQVETLTAPSTGDLIRGLGFYHPGVVHISGSIGESTHSGGVYFRFGSPYRSDAGGLLDGRKLMKILGAGGPGPPLVIIDPTRPTASSELVRQVMLRNLLAAELFGFGGISAVLATGFFGPEEQDRVYSALARAIRQRGSLREFAEAIRWSASGEGDPLVRDAIALFTTSPDLRVESF